MSSFKDLGLFVHNNPAAEAQRSSAPTAHARSLSCNSTLPARNFFVVNEKPLHLEKTTSSVPSVMLFIYEFKTRILNPPLLHSYTSFKTRLCLE